MITTKEVQKMMSADPKKLDMKIKLDVEGIQDDSDMGTADALRHIQRKIKVRDFSDNNRRYFQLLSEYWSAMCALPMVKAAHMYRFH